MIYVAGGSVVMSVAVNYVAKAIGAKWWICNYIDLMMMASLQ